MLLSTKICVFIMIDIELIAIIMNSLKQDSLFSVYGLLGLFINGVFSPILPFPPEITASVLILAGESKVYVAVTLAVSWIISSIFGYYVGTLGNKFFKERLIRNSKGKQSKDNNNKGEYKKKAFQLLSKYGWFILFVSPWIPIIGDLITIIAGIKRYDFKKYIISISAGKTVRAIVVVYLNALIMPLIFN